jgi:excisionase family DNA binding protein
MVQNIDLSRNRITTAEAAKRSGLSSIYLAQLARNGKIEGFQLGREWFLYTDAFEQFLATPRKSGPKGPRKKSKSDEPKTDETHETPPTEKP